MATMRRVGGKGAGKVAETAARSVRELAQRVGKSHTAVAGWLKDDRWTFSRQGPWNAGTIEQIRIWAASTLAPDPSARAGTVDLGQAPAMGAERAVKTLLIKEKYESQKFTNERNREKFHSVELCRKRKLQQITAVRNELTNLGRALQPSLGLTDDQVLGIEQRCEEILESFAQA